MDTIGQKENKTLRDKLWYELLYAKKTELYYAYSLLHKKILKKYLNSLLLVFTVTGAVLYPFLGYYAPLIGCSISAISVLLSDVLPIFPTNEEIKQIEQLRDTSLKYFHSLEKFWHDCHDLEKYSDTDVVNLFFELRKTKENMETLDAYIGMKLNKRANKKADKQAMNYISTYLL
jgi:hypothetical protein